MNEISEHKREGLSIWAISRLTGYDRKTISRYLLTPAGRPVYHNLRHVLVSRLEPFKANLKDRQWNLFEMVQMTAFGSRQRTC